jgi:ATP-dependent Clp protease adaptor protein ClpS
MAQDDDQSESPVSTPEAPQARPKKGRRRKQRTSGRVSKLPPWNVVLLDDDEHTYEYVIEMLGRVFSHGLERAFMMACEVDTSGRVIVFTGHRELAELKCQQIRHYGLDPRLGKSCGSMRAVIEPAPG